MSACSGLFLCKWEVMRLNCSCAEKCADVAWEGEMRQELQICAEGNKLPVLTCCMISPGFERFNIWQTFSLPQWTELCTVGKINLCV
jgi:hypothetical protein